MNNGITAHVWNEQHHVDWSAARVRSFEQHPWKRTLSIGSHLDQTRTELFKSGLWTKPESGLVPSLGLFTYSVAIVITFCIFTSIFQPHPFSYYMHTSIYLVGCASCLCSVVTS